MAKVTFKVEGFKQLADNLHALSNNMLKRGSRQAVNAGARVVVAAAREGAPVDTGALKKHIGMRRDILESRKGLEVRAVGVFKIPGGTYTKSKRNKRKGLAGKSYDVDPPTFYWKFNELGTVKQPARPFIAPALSQNISQVTNAMKQKLADFHAKVQKK